MRKRHVLAILALIVILFWASPMFGDDFSQLAAQAEAARSANRTSDAIDLYQKALALNPNWQEGWWYAGSLLYGSSHYAEARDAFQKLLALDPNFTPAVGMLGLCEFATADYEHALPHVEQALNSPAIHKQPEIEGLLRYHKALLLTHSGQFDKALAEYLWFASNGIKSDPLFAGIGLAALRSPLVPKDIPAGKLALYMTTGKVSYAMLAGDSPDAEEGMRWLLQQFPQTANLHYLYGSFLMSANPDAAIDQFRQELQLNPDSGAANAMLAWTLVNWNEYAQALPAAQKAVQLEPQDEIAQYVLGQALIGQNQIEAGIAHLELAVKAGPSDARPHIALAMAYWTSAKPVEARRESELAVRLAKEGAAASGGKNANVQ